MMISAEVKCAVIVHNKHQLLLVAQLALVRPSLCSQRNQQRISIFRAVDLLGPSGSVPTASINSLCTITHGTYGLMPTKLPRNVTSVARWSNEATT